MTVMAKMPDDFSLGSTEPWLKVPYTVVDIEPNLLDSWSKLTVGSNFKLPQPNPYIPQELKLLSDHVDPNEQTYPLPTPKKLIDSEKGTLYYALDTHFKVPRVFWTFNIKTPAITSGTPSKEVLAELFCYNLMENLNPLNYAAKVAELNYDISPSSNGIMVTITGYSENAEKLFDTLIGKLKDSLPTPEHFKLYKEDLIRDYRNRAHEGPLKSSFEAFHSIIYESYSTSAQKADALEQVSYDDYKDFNASLFLQTFTEAVIFGNVGETQAEGIWSKLEKLLDSTPYPKNEQFVDKVIILPEEKGPHAVQINVETPANAAMLAIEFPDFSFRGRAAQQILAQAMSSEFFATLRTKQQTGYLIASNAEEYQKKLFSYFAVQSSTHDPRDLLARFELFIESFLQDLDNHLSQSRFELIKSSLIESLMSTPQNLTEAGLLLNRLAFKIDADFSWMEKRIQGFKELTYEEFVDFSHQFFNRQNKRRLAILVTGETDEGFQYVTWLDSKEMKGLSNYKK
jgi:insulysin